jgi:hypothetical protein
VRVNGYERNRQHQNYAKKYDWKRVVGFETDDECEVFEVEKILVGALHTFVKDTEKSLYACNQTLGGEGNGMFGKQHSEETRSLISEKLIGQSLTKERCKNISVGAKSLGQLIEKNVVSLQKKLQIVKRAKNCCENVGQVLKIQTLVQSNSTQEMVNSLCNITQ